MYGLWWWESLSSAPETSSCYFCSCWKCKCLICWAEPHQGPTALGLPLSLRSVTLPSHPPCCTHCIFLFFQAQVNGFTCIQQDGQLTHSFYLRAPFPCDHCPEGTLTASATPSTPPGAGPTAVCHLQQHLHWFRSSTDSRAGLRGHSQTYKFNQFLSCTQKSPVYRGWSG